MEFISIFFTRTLPNYLQKLPVPKSVASFSDVPREDWIVLVPFFAAVTFTLYATTKVFLGIFTLPKRKVPPVNQNVEKLNPKVVNAVDIEDIFKGGANKMAFCRCWRSEKFPYCDGTHNTYNEESGDNVGPLIVKRTLKK